MGRPRSLRSKAAHFVTDLTTGLLNPISDKPSKPSPPPPPTPAEDVDESKGSQNGSMSEERPPILVDGPDTSSFTAFLYSLLSSSESGDKGKTSDEQIDDQMDKSNSSSDSIMKASSGKKSLFSKGKHTLSKAMYQAARFGGYRGQERKDISEPSLLLTEKTRSALYSSLPALVQGRQWLLLYSTWRHGISLSTLYRRSMLGLASVCWLLETVKVQFLVAWWREQMIHCFHKYTWPSCYISPYRCQSLFTLCATDFLAIGGGGHFALYLNSDLLSGSSSVSETYGNPCLAHSEDFDVKEVELWGFVYATKYEEVLAQSRTEAPGICRW
ncbi:hypothetical protein M0R45_000679 [Rubus argutus]|uniref:Oxidation resistance protein 1 n=1 Tax=Rubus argutus TaxID=59490 RepID=A0AAW1VNK7_RUBAR